MIPTALGKQAALRRHLRRLVSNGKYRKSEEQAILVGEKVVEEAMAHHIDHIETLIACVDTPIESNLPVAYLDKADYKEITNLDTPPPVAALIRIPSWDSAQILATAKRVIFLDTIQDPRNLGTIVRTAAAFGWDAVITQNSVDLYHPKALRASSGACWHCPVLANNEVKLVENDWEIITLSPYATQPLECYASQSNKAKLLVLGSEGQGLSEQWDSIADLQSYRIPISQNIDSLNVAATASIAAFMIK